MDNALGSPFACVLYDGMQILSEVLPLPFRCANKVLEQCNRLTLELSSAAVDAEKAKSGAARQSPVHALAWKKELIRGGKCSRAGPAKNCVPTNGTGPRSIQCIFTWLSGRSAYFRAGGTALLRQLPKKQYPRGRDAVPK
ncbi:hypothetical protein Anapl_16607 [Anas platyrhynchos]|uniref:Uncharacterized protein n=1 Tax=Anas platyrhynchos TaxID=8839 RepID=R0J9K0_ANAPL|nr:hypothetical protein Anapl_16607 [Anas platyrhynchos]